MAKHTTPLALAKSPRHLHEIDEIVSKIVDDLCGLGDYDKAQQLFQLLDLLTNPDYERDNREDLTFTAIRRCFLYTRACEAALKNEVARVTPIATRKEA